MRSVTSRILSVLLAVVLVLSSVPLTALNISLPVKSIGAPVANAAEFLTSGFCGDTVNGDGTNIAWSIDEDGLLTLTGTGIMGSTPNREDNRVTKVIVGEGITHLADYAFAYCQNLTDVVLPSTLETTGCFAFEYDFALVNIDFGGTKVIGKSSFYNCSNLKSVEIPGTVEKIQYDAFAHAGLSEIIFHEGLREIADGAFSYMWYAASIDLPDSLETIGNRAFYNCIRLKTVNLGSGVKTVGGSAFADCQQLTGEIVFPDSCIFVGEGAFSNTAITAFDIGAGVTNFGTSTGMLSLKRIEVSEENSVYASYDGVLYTKGYTKLIQVPAISVLNIPSDFAMQDGNFLQGWSMITYINIPEENENYKSVDGIVYTKDGSVLVVCPRGIEGRVTVVDGTKVIGKSSFYNCSNIKSVEIPGTVEKIQYDAFAHAGLSEIIFHEGLREIADGAFSYMWYAASIDLPDSLETIGNRAFYNCIRLKTVNLGSGVKTVGGGAFADCSSLASVRLSESLESWDLGNIGFSTITSLTVPNRYTNLKNYGGVKVPASGGIIRGYCGSSAHEMAIKRLYTFESLSHTFLNWYTVTPATFEHNGSERRDCAYCDGYEERIIPQLHKDTYTATFVADGRVVATVDFQKGTTSIEEPAVPARDRYTGRWEEYTLSDEDITINAIYTIIQSGDAGEIQAESTVTHYTETDDVLFKLKVFSPAKTVKSVVSRSIPLDIILVVDQSGSMENTLGGSVKKVDALKSAAESFIESVSENAALTGADHRIAIAGFGLAGSYSGFLYNENTELLTSPRGIVNYSDITSADYAGALISISEKDVLLNAVSAIEARGATAADLGLEMAKGIFANTDSTGRERVVVFMTDGEPTYSSSFQTSVANSAVYNAKLLKNTYDALIYSVGIFSSAEASNSKIKSFMNAVSSNYPNAGSYNSLGAAASDAFSITINNTNALSDVFKTITTESFSHTAAFENVTLIKTLSEYVTLTAPQEQALRVDVMRKYGISNDQISVTVDDHGRTAIRIDGLVPYEVTDEKGNVSYEITVEFFASLNEKAANAGSYTVDTDDSGVMLGDGIGYEATFGTGDITLTAKKNRYIFTINGEVYEITEGSSISSCVPETDFASDWDFSGWDTSGVDSKNGVIVDASLVKAPRTIIWHTDDGDVTQIYVEGDIITPPEVNDRADGSKFLSWDRSLPTVMPDTDLEFTAVYGPHIHRYTSSVTTKVTCLTDGVLTYVCTCGDTYTETVDALGHNYEAITASTDNDASKCTFVCTNCGDKYEYALSYQVVSSSNSKGKILYEFDLTDDDLETGFQPDGSIDIRIPLSDFQGNAKNVVVRRYVNGKWEDVPAVIEDGYLIITADHFTPYDVQFIFTCSETGEHEWGDGEVIKEAACSENGVRHLVCSLCEEEKDEAIPATGKHIDADGDGYCDYGCGTAVKDPAEGDENSKVCKYCGKTHTGLIGEIIRIFHNIIYIIKHLFS
ncbi:MAG: leucine-rich repeat protein [Oscillospiraceae bacterium]|nr:leucine-rich repeat protein [Oscillospiraceae bacterium]